MLFAESSGSGLGALIVLFILALGAARIGRTIRGSSAITDAGKSVMLGLLGRIFRR